MRANRTRILTLTLNVHYSFFGFVAGSIITSIFYGLNGSFRPYATASLNRTQASTLVSLFLNLFLGILLCLSRYMDLERQQACKDEFESTCSAWKSVERRVVEAIITVITLSVPLVPIFNYLSPAITKVNIFKMQKCLLSLCKSDKRDWDPAGRTFADIVQQQGQI